MTGVHRRSRHRALTTAAALALAAGGIACKGNADATKTAAPATGMTVGPENFAIVKTQQIRSGPSISGSLTPEEQATVRAEVGGSVLQTYVEQGQPVKKGSPLVRIDDATLREAVLSARAALSTAQNSADIAKKQVDRDETLLKAGAIA